MVRASKYEVDWTLQQQVDDFLKKHQKVVGIDEVGRGAVAGPILVAGVSFKTLINHFLITDSKLLSREERYKAKGIIESVMDYSKFCEITVDKINQNKVNLNVLIKQAIMEILDDAAKHGITGALIDWIKVDHPLIETLSLQRMELISRSTAAASILAKIKRDEMMKMYDKTYPGYEFAKNSGYCTNGHLEHMKNKGLSTFHRTFFALKAMSKFQNNKRDKNVK